MYVFLLDFVLLSEFYYVLFDFFVQKKKKKCKKGETTNIDWSCVLYLPNSLCPISNFFFYIKINIYTTKKKNAIKKLKLTTNRWSIQRTLSLWNCRNAIVENGIWARRWHGETVVSIVVTRAAILRGSGVAQFRQ